MVGMVLETLDGFSSHTNNLEANELRIKNKVDSLKESGDSSSLNQAYDRDAAKADKDVHRTHLGFLRQTKLKTR